MNLFKVKFSCCWGKTGKVPHLPDISSFTRASLTSFVVRAVQHKLVHQGFQSARDEVLCVKWVPVTTAWRVLRLRMEERPPIWRVAANKLNKQSRTADEGWSSSLGVGRDANNTSP